MLKDVTILSIIAYVFGERTKRKLIDAPLPEMGFRHSEKRTKLLRKLMVTGIPQFIHRRIRPFPPAHIGGQQQISRSEPPVLRNETQQ
ncbi:hypothetical protein D3C73_1522570 [compost metagenome]